ncbi:MAG: hypothetical protein BWX99_01111 [Deltaproteobacteria bacterium ADurb.Bin151]|nr:MAG: hypothetical protein BWX99_01111 [Deltaproteobacteria bacterium ADurb.Bin151]
MFIIAVIGRVNANHHEEISGSLADRNPLLLNGLGKLWQGLVNAVLDIHLGQIWISADIEEYTEDHHPRAGTRGGHVDHVVGAVDLQFDWSGDILGNHIGAGSGISRVNGDNGR